MLFIIVGKWELGSLCWWVMVDYMEGCMGNGINKEMEMIMGEFCIFEFSVMKKNYKKE
jgi:hypothetical protein